ncbi:hypothetical protein [Serratia symbiotica]|uniref:hypothetical protein n=1 Tax=Serratia symbiotica TaxID=138074 RepID=UPI0034647DFC
MNVVDYALKQGYLPTGSQVFFHVSPHSENTPKPDLLIILANKLVSEGVGVKVVESAKPIYGYMNEKTGSSNEPEILKRIALHPLRDKERSQKTSFLDKYFHHKPLVQHSDIKYYTKGDSFEDLPRTSSSNLIENIVSVNGKKKENIWILSDMDPGLQKPHLYITFLRTTGLISKIMLF